MGGTKAYISVSSLRFVGGNKNSSSFFPRLQFFFVFMGTKSYVA